MTAQPLPGLKEAILVADGFTQVEPVKPKAALEAADARSAAGSDPMACGSPTPGHAR